MPQYLFSAGLGFVFVAFLSIQARALECTAPGHSSCTISCPSHCGATYLEPNGPCTKYCASTIRPDQLDVQIEGLTKDQLDSIDSAIKGQTKDSAIKGQTK
jgi:hypothetical protein